MYRLELRYDSGSEIAFKIGHEVGELARRLFDENGDGNLIEPKEMGWPEAYTRTQELLKSSETPTFEATIRDQRCARTGGCYAPRSVIGSASVKNDRDEILYQR